VSFADLQRMPDDGNRYELYDGELRVVPSPMLLHQRIVGRLHLLLSAYVQSAGGEVFMAPLDVVLTEYDVVEPDLIVFGPEKARRLEPLEHVYFPPDLAVEVLSPSTARIDRGPKSVLLAKHRVPEYWLVDPQERTLEVRIERAGGYPDPIVLAGGTYRSVSLPGLVIDVEALFA
jgi:Uma2 family endonuclease